MINEKNARGVCCEDISKIENYDKAISDTTQTWHCHHRRETIYTKDGLIEIGEYYHRPAAELIFLTPFDHNKIHHRGKTLSEWHKERVREAQRGNKYNLGRHPSKEARMKISAAKSGKKMSIETRKRMSAAQRGKVLSEETKRKISLNHADVSGNNNPMYGHKGAALGKHWYNNGEKELYAFECPEGFVPGRMKK